MAGAVVADPTAAAVAVARAGGQVAAGRAVDLAVPRHAAAAEARAAATGDAVRARHPAAALAGSLHAAARDDACQSLAAVAGRHAAGARGPASGPATDRQRHLLAAARARRRDDRDRDREERASQLHVWNVGLQLPEQHCASAVHGVELLRQQAWLKQ